MGVVSSHTCTLDYTITPIIKPTKFKLDVRSLCSLIEMLISLTELKKKTLPKKFSLRCHHNPNFAKIFSLRCHHNPIFASSVRVSRLPDSARHRDSSLSEMQFRRLQRLQLSVKESVSRVSRREGSTRELQHVVRN